MTKKIIVIAVVVLIIDQFLKVLVDANMLLNESITVINNLFYITYTNNYGAAWGIFQNQIFFLVTVSLIALIIIYRFMFTFKSNLRNEIAFGLLFGGIAGNLLDRLFLGSVRDFIDLRIFGYHFPVFNIADIVIVIGVFLLIFAIIKGEDHENNRRRKS